MLPFFWRQLITIYWYIHSSSISIFVLYIWIMVILFIWQYLFIWSYPHSYRPSISFILIILVYNNIINNIIIFFILFYKLLILEINSINFFLYLFHFIISILLHIFYHLKLINCINIYFINIILNVNTNKFSNNIFSHLLILLLFNLLLS